MDTRRAFMTGIIFFSLVCLCSVTAAAEPKPGDVYDASNWQEVVDYLPPAAVEMLKTHGLVINVAENKEYPHSPKYLEATEKYKGQAKIMDDGSLQNFSAGMPFPDIDLNDPDVARKIGWNMEVRSQPEQRYYNPFSFIWVNKNGNIERKVTGRDRKLYYVGRVVNEPTPMIPNNDGINYKELLYFFEPRDVAGVGFLVIKYLGADKDDDAWAYVPAMRRVRRMTSGMTTDAYLGSDITIEDFDAFSGKPADYNYKCLGKKKILFVRDRGEQSGMNTHGPYGWTPPPGLNWELRDCYIMEVKAKWEGHPYSKRIMYVDTQHFNIPYSEMFDKKGDFWKFWFRHELYHPDYGWFTDSCESVIDFQAMHATLVTANCIPQNEGYTEAMFTVDELEKTGH